MAALQLANVAKITLDLVRKVSEDIKSNAIDLNETNSTARREVIDRLQQQVAIARRKLDGELT